MINYEKFSDEQIIEIVRASNPELFSIIMRRYQDKLIRYVNNLTRNKDLTTDVVQESFIKVFINLRGFNTKMKFSSWIYRIAHNEAVNAIKKFSKEVSFPENIDFSSDEDIQEDYEKTETVARVEKCFDKMPILYSEPLSLYYIEEKSYEEISDILRIPMGTVATRINRAKILMKKICQKI